MITVGLYVRVSTQEQAQEGYSIGEQTERLKGYSKAMGWKVYKVYIDPGYSGGSLNRPALQQLIDDVNDHRIQKVVVYKLDRLSRSQKDTLSLIEDVFNTNNVDFVSMCENFDTSTAFGRASIGILSVFAQLEREQIKERMSMGKDARVKTGKWMGSNNIPIGYDYKDSELIINEYEKIQVLKIFDMFLSGSSMRKIANTLNQSGYHNKFGKWSNKSVMRVLQSRTYIGEIYFKGQWYPGNHERIISDQEHEKTMQLLTLVREKYSKNLRPGKAGSYLAGLLYCDKCGAKYHKIGTKNTYYSCASRAKRSMHMVKDPNCKNKNWKIEVLDEIVFEQIRQLSMDHGYKPEQPEEQNDKDKVILSEIAKIDHQMSKLMELYSMDQVPIDMLQDKIHTLSDNRDALMKELDTIKNPVITKEDADEMIKSFEEVLERGSFDEIRYLLTSLIDRIDLNDEDVTIHWNF